MTSTLKDIEQVTSFGIILFDNHEVIDDLPTEINQDIVFVDVESWKVYENYAINDKVIKRQLGFFNNVFKYVPTMKLSFNNRRGNFHGYQMKAMTEHYPPVLSIDLSSAKYDDMSHTYDVTNSTSGMFYSIFQDLKESLNFTSSLHKRRDGKWGPTTVLANGSVIAEGIAQSLTSGFAEIIVTAFAQTLPRAHALDLLPAILNAKTEIFIKTIDDEALSWTAYLNPFSNDMWLVVVLVSLVISFFLTFIERLFCSKDQEFTPMIFFANLWVALKANAGGKPTKSQKNTIYRIVLFDCLLVGSVIWMAYRASFTSELSVTKLKLPFNDLESLSKTGYRLIAPPSDYSISLLFQNSKKDSIYGRLYQNNMDGPRSFYKDEAALKQLVASEKVAFVQIGDPIHFLEDYHCKIYSVWKGHVPLYTESMAMRKQSPLTPFIEHGIRKMAESGITNLHNKRHIVSAPNCKPLQSKGRPLGLEKLAFLFTFYFIGCIISLITLVIENIYKSFSCRKKTQGNPSMQSHKEELIKRIDALEEAITSFLDNNEGNKLTAQQIQILLLEMKKIA